MKFKGHSLIHVIVLLLIVSILSGLLLTIVRVYSLRSEHIAQNIRQLRTIDELFQANSSLTDKLEYTDQWERMTLLNYNDDFRIDYKYYRIGYRTVLCFRSVNLLDTVARSCLLGYEIPNIALYLEPSFQYIRYGGHSYAKGDVYSNSGGFVGTSILNESPSNMVFLTGGIDKVSKKNNAILLKLKDYLTNEHSKLEYMKTEDYSFKNSFLSAPLEVVLSRRILSRYDTLEGNIIITHPDSIVIPSKIHLKNVTLISPVIRIKSNSIHDGIQLIATKEISVGANSKLQYPSLLLLNGMSGKITLEDSTVVHGDVLFKSGTEKRNIKSQTRIAKGSIVNGTLNILGNMDCRGVVNGFTYCRKTLVTTSSSFYTNHILNGRFNREGLSPYQVSHIPYFKTSKIMKWLN